ncbi:MAG: DNA primase [Bacillota bacterium]
MEKKYEKDYIGDGMTIRLNEEIIEEIKARNNIVDVASRYIQFKKSGRNYKALCPFHHEKTPSFMVSEERQNYKCFGCGNTGDVISFVMNIENLDFVDAVTLMGEWVGIHVDEISTNRQEKEEINRRNKIYEVNREAAIFYYKNLNEKDNPGLRYLVKRGVDVKTIKKFGLGYALDEWESLNRYLLKKGFDQQIIVQAGLALQKENRSSCYDRFRNRIIFPIINTKRKIIGFGGRAIDQSLPKYLNSPETPVFNKGYNLYGINLAKNEIGKERRIIVVEGYMDVISLYQFGIKNVVASLGTALTKNQGEMLKRYADEIIIAYDTDAAGQAATLRGLEILKELDCQVKVIRLSDGKDPDELIRQKGLKAFQKEIGNALSLIEYKIMLAKRENDLSTTEGRIHFVKKVAELLKEVKSPVEVDAYIKKTAVETQISEEAIKKEIYGNNMYHSGNNPQKPENTRSKYRSGYDRNTNKDSIQLIKPVKKQGYVEAERGLIKIMLFNKAFFAKIMEHISYEVFLDETNKHIVQLLKNVYENTETPDRDFIESQLDIDTISILHEIDKIVIAEDNIDKTIHDFVQALKKHKLMSRKEQIEWEIKQLEKTENKSLKEIARIRELCIEIEGLLKEIKNM